MNQTDVKDTDIYFFLSQVGDCVGETDNMACTSQSAVQYIENARDLLVGNLQNLSVIVENLFQKGFLLKEEVSKIQAETDDFDKTRKILDLVINKGDATCYELLKIIDITRKRTLVRSLPLPEQTESLSNQKDKFDLHHWISCFSFKEDTDMDRSYSKGK